MQNVEIEVVWERQCLHSMESIWLPIRF